MWWSSGGGIGCGGHLGGIGYYSHLWGMWCDGHLGALGIMVTCGECGMMVIGGGGVLGVVVIGGEEEVVSAEWEPLGGILLVKKVD